MFVALFLAARLRSNPVITNENLKALANEILYIYPPELIKVSACLANTAELAVHAGVEFDVSQLNKNIADWKQMLEL